MNRLIRAGGSHSRPGIVLVAVLVAACASTAPTPSPSVVPPAAAPPSAAATPSAVAATPASPPSSASPAAESAAPSASSTAGGPVQGFTTQAPPAPDATWSSISWQPIAATDPLGSVTGMVRAPGGGYVAWANPVALTSTTSASPVWSSSDGATWNPLPAGTFGPAGIVVGLGSTNNGLLALTLTGGANGCGDNGTIGCWTPAGPLKAWTSADGVTWSPGTAPDVTLTSTCDTCGVDVPFVAYGAPGVLVETTSSGRDRMDVSTDGASWQRVPAGALPAKAQLTPGAYGDQFVALGNDGRSPGTAEVATSPDGLTWHVAALPGRTHGGEGAEADALLGAAHGALVGGTTQSVPGGGLSWTSPDLKAWRAVNGEPPLGVWKGEGEGSGLIADGSVAADGQRLLALTNDGAVKSWTSGDGRTWAAIPSTGLPAQPAHSWPALDLSLLPVGALMKDQSGASWLGVPNS